MLPQVTVGELVKELLMRNEEETAWFMIREVLKEEDRLVIGEAERKLILEGRVDDPRRVGLRVPAMG